MKNKKLMLLFTILSGFALAESNGIDSSNIFLPSSQDLSIHYLTQIFGAVGNQLSGAGTQIVGQMLGVFNLGMIIFAGGFVSYTVFNSVINAANDGGGMQGKMSAWIPFRIVTGVALLVPQFNGYSMIQVTVMWAVLQGIGLADNVWNTALNYIKNTGGAVYTQASESTYTDLRTLISDKAASAGKPAYVGDFYKSGICLALYNKQINGNAQSVKALSAKTSGVTASQSKTTGQVLFGKACKTGKDDAVCFGTPDKPTACGAFAWDPGQAIDPSKINGTYNDVSAGTTMQNSVQTIAIMMASAGKEVVDTYYNYKSQHKADDDPASDAVKDLTCDTTTDSLKGYCQPGSSLVASAASYLANTKPLRYISNTTTDKTKKWYESAVQTGWIGAGSQYYNLVNTDTDAQVKLKPVSTVLSKIANPIPSNTLSKDYANVYNQIIDSPMSSYYKRANAVINSQQAADVNQRPTDSDHSAYQSELGDLNAIASQMIKALVYNTNLDLKSSVMSAGSSGYDWSSGGTNLTVGQDNLEVMLKKIYSEMLGIKAFNNATNKPNWNEGDKGRDFSHSDLNPYPSGVYCNIPSVTSACNIDSDEQQKLSSQFKMFTALSSSIDPSYNAKAANEKYASDTDSKKSCFEQAVKNGCIQDRQGLLGSFSALQENQPVDPLLITTQLGMTMLDASVTYWVKTINGVYQAMKSMVSGYTGMMITTGVAAGTIQGLLAAFAPGPVGSIVGGIAGATGNILIAVAKMFFSFDQTVLTIFLPFGAAVALTFFVLGSTLGIYVPLVPFLIYLFSVIGWFIAVIEAMIAAPLVALGVTHPEGHDLLGKAEQSVILLLGVFIRPVTILLGFITAILLINIAMNLLNYGFVGIFSSYLSHSLSLSGTDQNMIKLVGSLGVLIVYAYAVINIVDQVFGLIYQVPEKILRWIGAAPEQSGVGQMMGQMRQGVSQSASSAGQGASSAAGRGPSMQPHGEMKEAKFAKSDAKGSSAQAGGDDAGGSGN
ncbi:DotA/TraY family protein [Gammaproteobacteria bacterium]|nr:DotA/TraY family protein [Gammaproteobacteria bacterium]